MHSMSEEACKVIQTFCEKTLCFLSAVAYHLRKVSELLRKVSEHSRTCLCYRTFLRNRIGTGQNRHRV